LYTDGVKKEERKGDENPGKLHKTKHPAKAKGERKGKEGFQEEEKNPTTLKSV
jgi:hypothetical protein